MIECLRADQKEQIYRKITFFFLSFSYIFLYIFLSTLSLLMLLDILYKNVSFPNSEKRKNIFLSRGFNFVKLAKIHGNRENLSLKQFLPLRYSCHYFHIAQSRNENQDETEIWAAETFNWHSIYFVILWNRNKSILSVSSPKYEFF